MADHQPHTANGTQPPHVNGEDHSSGFPEALTPLWDRLPPEVHDLFLGPYDRRDKSYRHYVQDWLTAARDHGWQLVDCLALAGSDWAKEWAKEGIRKNQGWRKVLREVWDDINPPPPKDEPPPLPLEWFEDMKPVLTTRDFVQGVLVEKALTVVYGDSHAGKTFWATDLTLHVATGKRWNGRRVDQGGVVYVCLEGGDGFLNRVAAWKAANPEVCTGTVPFAAVRSTINLLHPDADTGKLIESVKAAAKQRGFPVKLIVVDTLSRAMAGGNENSPEDMGALVINADRIRAETGACLVFVHHSGKDAAKGARGHSLLRAAVDTEIEVVHDETTGIRTASVVKQRDMAKSEAIGFRLDTVVLGENQHGEAVTTCTVSPIADGEAKPRRNEAKLADKPATLLHVIRNLPPDLLEEVRPFPEMPLCKAVPREALRDALIADGWFPESHIEPAFNPGKPVKAEKAEPASKPRKLVKAAYVTENNALRALKTKGIANFNRHWVWLL